MALIAGAHMSMADGFPEAVREAAEELGGNAMQIFLKSPRGGKARDIPESEITEFRKNCREFGMKFVMGHASYLLNFAKPLESGSWQFENIIYDLTALEKLGGHGLALHVGKFLDLPREQALADLVENLALILEKTSDLSVPILLENGAGQGSELGVKFEEIAEIFKAMGKPKRIRFCIDTCHCFAAGYDLATPKGVAGWEKEVEKHLGWSHVSALHLNDSKGECGGHLDRHENVGKGKIGMAGMEALVKIAVKRSIPMILETPLDNDGHKKDLALVKKMANL